MYQEMVRTTNRVQSRRSWERPTRGESILLEDTFRLLIEIAPPGVYLIDDPGTAFLRCGCPVPGRDFRRIKERVAFVSRPFIDGDLAAQTRLLNLCCGRKSPAIYLQGAGDSLSSYIRRADAGKNAENYFKGNEVSSVHRNSVSSRLGVLRAVGKICTINPGKHIRIARPVCLFHASNITFSPP